MCLDVALGLVDDTPFSLLLSRPKACSSRLLPGTCLVLIYGLEVEHQALLLGLCSPGCRHGRAQLIGAARLRGVVDAAPLHTDGTCDSMQDQRRSWWAACGCHRTSGAHLQGRQTQPGGPSHIPALHGLCWGLRTGPGRSAVAASKGVRCAGSGRGPGQPV